MADGYQEIPGTGWGQQDIAAVGWDLEFRLGGAEIAWDTVPPVAGAPVIIPGGPRIEVGEKYLRQGAVMVEITSGPNIRKVGPFDTAATDGRQTLDPDTFAGLTRVPIVYRPNVLQRGRDTKVGLVTGGSVIAGMIQAGGGAASLANGPTWATLRAAAPRLVTVASRAYRAAHT